MDGSPAMLAIDPLHPDISLLKRVADLVRRGGIIVYPTETVYGIGADALNPAAVRRVIRVKRRADPKPILVIVSARRAVVPLVQRISPDAEVLMEHFWPGPLTLVFKAAKEVPREISRDSGTIGIRVPSSPLCLQLCESTGKPLTSTSANISGEAVAGTVQEIRAEFGDSIDLYIDGGPLSGRMPSTVIDVASDVPAVIREGAVPVEQIRRLLPHLSQKV